MIDELNKLTEGKDYGIKDSFGNPLAIGDSYKVLDIDGNELPKIDKVQFSLVHNDIRLDLPSKIKKI